MPHVRLVLVLDALAAALIGGAVLFAVGAPLAAAGRLGPRTLAGLAGVTVAAVLIVAAALLLRSVARPVERVLRTADRLGGASAFLPPLLPQASGRAASLGDVAIAFERVAGALEEERRSLAVKVAELERANASLAEARESWVRSERLASLGRLASGLAHEVGNPLGAISGYAALARARLGAATPQVGDLLERIEVEAARIDRLVRDMLDFARPSPLVCVPMALRPPLDAALRLARVQPRFQDVAVTVHLAEGLPPVLADEARLAQVLLNLLLNAGDAMGGRGRVTIDAGREGEGLELRVVDEGPGIPPQDLPHIFDPFFTTKAPGAGTGLGLSVCHRMMEDMGGRIEAGGASTGGAVFRLWLRAASGPAAMSPQRAC